MKGEPTNNTTRVTFNITVPAYKPSDELRVILEWGSVGLMATWVADESWAATTDLPVNTTNFLTVTFSDKNGAIALASLANSGAVYLF